MTTELNNGAIWFCPSRWLLAHHDPQANINTMSSHLCLADLNSDGENLLALVDFKPGPSLQQPYQCRLRVYRGKHLIYNHFLDDLPSCMVVTSNRIPNVRAQQQPAGHTSVGKSALHRQNSTSSPRMVDRLLLTLPINDDIYFYHQLKPQHRISLEDDPRILETLNKSELDVWQMVKQNKVDVETMRELLVSLSDAHGAQELTSHSNNFLALASQEERKNYLLLWKFKKLSNGAGEHIMSMDTICCAAARLRFDPSLSGSTEHLKSGGGGGSPASYPIRWNKLLDIQKDGIVLGTEDRHLLVYELGSSRAYLEANYRLPSSPDHILVERRSPLNLDPKCNLQELTYKILVSCRNCRIYVIDQNYLPDRRHSSSSKTDNPTSAVRELIGLSSNVIDMCWTAEDDLTAVSSTTPGETSSPSAAQRAGPNFIVACLDRRVYCFSSETGQNKWVAELEMPISCLVSLPIPRVSQDETSLVGVASETNRIDFYISSSGRIVDSIYLSDDYCQAMTFGRFGREDNCLCLTTSKGSLLILILKRTAKFANAQCLSSAAAYASHVVTASCSSSSSSPPPPQVMAQRDEGAAESRGQKLSQMKEPPELPKPFAITKSAIVNPTDRALDQIQLNHNCDQVVAKEALDSHLLMPKLQIPAKNRDYVDQIVHQTRHAKLTSKVFARDMLKLRDKVRLASQQQGELMGYEDANRVSLTNVIGLGNIYRVSLSLRLEIANLSTTQNIDTKLAASRESDQPALGSPVATSKMTAQVILVVAAKQRRCHLHPFKFDLHLEELIKSEPDLIQDANRQDSKSVILETSVTFKLILLGHDNSADANQVAHEEDSITLDVYVLPPRPGVGSGCSDKLAYRPSLVSSINVPTCQ